MFRHIRASVCIAALLLGLVTSAKAQITYYTNIMAFNAASNTTLVEDFESITPKDTPLSSFSHNGNTYTGLAGAPFSNVDVASPGYTNFGVLVTTSSVLTANGDEDFRVDFGTPRTAVGFDTYTNIYGPAAISLYGASGLLDTYTLTQDSTKVGFWGATSSQLITAIRWTTINGRAVNTGIDNIRLGAVTAAVPEPGSIALLVASGLTGCALLLRRWK